MKMKKLLFITSVLISALLFGSATESFAQNEHLKFAGIPLDGTITQFHQKLIAKGYKSDIELTKRLSASRAYEGVFAGEKCNVYVYFDIKTNKVYRAKAVVMSLSESTAKQKYDSMLSKLMQKYNETNSILKEDKESHFVSSYFILPMREEYNEFLTTWGNSYGSISIYIVESEDKFNYPYHFSLHIDYEDQLNSDAHNRNVEDDL